MKALKQQLASILAQADGARYDRVASGFVAIIGLFAAAAPFVHLIPGQAGLKIAGLCAGAGAFLPRATKAAGILKVAYGQQKPLIQVLPELWATLVAGPSIIAQARTDAQAAEAAQLKAQADQENEARIAQQVEQKFDAFKEEFLKSELGKTGQFPVEQLADVPAELKEALDAAQKTPVLSAVVTVADKAPGETGLIETGPSEAGPS